MTHISRSLPFNKLGHVVALAAVLVGMLIAGAGTAHATTQTEPFEANHANLRFYGMAPGTGGGWLQSNTSTIQTAYMGNGNAYLWSKNVGNWSTVERKFTRASHEPYCTVSARINPLGATRKFNLEIIDPATWRYVAVMPMQLSGSGYQFTGWQGRTSGGDLYVPQTNLVVRVVLLANSNSSSDALRVDELKLHCWNGVS